MFDVCDLRGTCEVRDMSGLFSLISYSPEGKLIESERNRYYLSSETTLKEAAAVMAVLEAKVTLCDNEHNLHVDLGDIKGVVPYSEGAMGIEDGTTRDIALISRVGKPISFVVTHFEEYNSKDEGAMGKRAVLSRKKAQQLCFENYIEKLQKGQVIPARVTRLESFGAFCDIGCGIPALIPIAALSVSRISHPKDRLSSGMDILGAVTALEKGRICLSQRELLGTWEENSKLFEQGETVSGIIRSVESYGIFIELTPNLAGLAEPREGVYPGDRAAVYIKSIIPEKMKLKLVIIDILKEEEEIIPPKYFIKKGIIKRWNYSPQNSSKIIETVFEE